MHSTAKTVDEYIAGFDGAKRGLLLELRQAILELAPDAVESMKHRLPFYEIGGDVFAFAVQKHHVSVYVNKADLIDLHARSIGRHGRGKNCIRYAKPEDADLPGLRKLILDAYGKSA